MKRPNYTIIIAIFCLTASHLAIAQYNEAGITFGGANYIGDLSEQRFVGENFGGMVGFFFRHNATEYFSLKSSLIKGSISASDALARTEANRMRNLHFRSDITELSLTGEVNFQKFNIRAQQTSVPYFFSGIAITHFNPQAQMRGKWYDLQPLETEGERYNRTILAVPFGLGMKFNLSYKVNFGFEVGGRKTFTDYLDDVSTAYPEIMPLRSSEPTTAALTYRTPEVTGEFGEDPSGLQRGNSTNNDWYFFAGITVSVNLTDKYGLDFDEKYDVFKEHLKKPEKESRRQTARKQKTSQYRQKKRKLFSKKKMIEPVAKKRTN